MTRVCSMFSQILRWFPRGEFDAAVREHKGERHARGGHLRAAVRGNAVLPVGARTFSLDVGPLDYV